MKQTQKKEIEALRNGLRMLFVQELRTPLSLIIAPLKELQKDNSQISNLSLQVAYRNSLRMVDACDQLLAIYRQGSPETKLEVAPYSVEKMIDSSVFGVRDLLKVYPIDFRCEKRVKKELEYFREHHIRIKILDIPTNMVELPEEQDWIFEMINNILIEVLASIAEQERITTKRRQSGVVAVAKEAGEHLGRPIIDFPPNWNQFYSDWKAGTITAVAAMRQLGLKRSTFYRLVKQQEEKHETEE